MATAISPGRRTVEKLAPAACHRGSGVHGRAAAHVRHDVGEDEEEEQRIHDDADEEGDHLAAQDVQVAQEEAGEGARVLHPLGCGGRMQRLRLWVASISGCVSPWASTSAVNSRIYSRRSRPVSRMKTVSRLVSVMVRSRRP